MTPHPLLRFLSVKVKLIMLIHVYEEKKKNLEVARILSCFGVVWNRMLIFSLTAFNLFNYLTSHITVIVVKETTERSLVLTEVPTYIEYAVYGNFLKSYQLRFVFYLKKWIKNKIKTKWNADVDDPISLSKWKISSIVSVLFSSIPYLTRP